MALDVSIVVAVYNEHPQNLLILLERVKAALQPTGRSYEVVFVNDGSRQPTSEALYQLAAEFENVKLVVLSRNFGQQAAISAGFDHCDGDAIVNIDSDCQDPPELIPQMVHLWKDGYDVVYAQRSTRRDKLSKKLSAFLFYRVLGSISSVKIPWDTGDFRLIDRKVLNALMEMPEKSRFLRGQIPWLGFKQIGIPIERGAREIGESTYTLRKLLSLAMDGILGFSVAPLYMVPTFGALLVAAGIIALLIFTAMSVAHHQVSPVLWITAVIAAFTGLQAMMIGVVAVYLSKVIDEVRGRPTYLVSDRVGFPFTKNNAYSRQQVRRDELVESTRQPS